MLVKYSSQCCEAKVVISTGIFSVFTYSDVASEFRGKPTIPKISNPNRNINSLILLMFSFLPLFIYKTI